MSFVSDEQQQQLLEVIRSAAAKLLEFYPGDPNSAGGATLQVEVKPDGSKVSEADFASNEILVNGINSIFPGDGIISEESPIAADVHQMSRVWIIDPLDGTSSFIAGEDDFSILVALVVDTQVEFGTMYFPAKNVFGYGKRGAGVLVDGEPAQVSNAEKLRPQSVCCRNFDPVSSDAVHPKWMDSGIAFLRLCCGDLDGVIIKMVRHKEWDLAAPIVLLEEAGGRATDENGNQLKFNQPEIEFEYLVASNGKTHEELLSLIPR